MARQEELARVPSEGDIPLRVRIRAYRQAQGIGLEEFGDRLGGFDARYASTLETKTTINLTPERMENVASALETTVSGLTEATREEVQEWVEKARHRMVEDRRRSRNLKKDQPVRLLGINQGPIASQPIPHMQPPGQALPQLPPFPKAAPKKKPGSTTPTPLAATKGAESQSHTASAKGSKKHPATADSRYSAARQAMVMAVSVEQAGRDSKQDWQKAIDLWMELLDAYPDYAFGYWELGTAHMYRGNQVEAVTFHRKAAELSPQYQKDFAQVHPDQEKPEGAESQVINVDLEALTQRPGVEDFFIGIAETLSHSELPDDSLRWAMALILENARSTCRVLKQ